MKNYEVNVVELHEIEKTYYIKAENKREARRLAKAGEWDDASGDMETGIINKRIVKSVEDYNY